MSTKRWQLFGPGGVLISVGFLIVTVLFMKFFPGEMWVCLAMSVAAIVLLALACWGITAVVNGLAARDKEKRQAKDRSS